ncbi:hypothetical protein NQ318_002948 [Aromia moschata]|uniref:HAT C-terminal dimerisation domain-containing protein n=1 Tax=Aromia moschata TaxID=1265417 RepID=A0AAV8X9E7_9CUCU|nr:hypothetical protein NQ318_002948 [Aromia moschata]
MPVTRETELVESCSTEKLVEFTDKRETTADWWREVGSRNAITVLLHHPVMIGCAKFAISRVAYFFPRGVSTFKVAQLANLAHLELCNEQAYPNMYRLLLIFCTIPVSTATPERTLSTLKHIKTYLRNSTSQNRLNGLAMMSIHRELPISENEIIDELAKSPKRLDFVT